MMYRPSTVSHVECEGDIDLILGWVRHTHAPGLATDLVPGATRTQRSHLAAAGGLVASLVGARQLRSWPEAVQTWVTDAPIPPTPVVNALQRALNADAEAFATIYCTLVAGENRRRLGTFFTPRPVVNFMLDMVTAPTGNCTIVDPGAGVGAFALAAATRWPTAEVIAVDVNIVTLGFLGAALSQASIGNVRLLHADYLTWLAEHRHRGGEPMILLGNPPYTRHQEFDAKSKKEMAGASHDLVTSQLAGLSAYFLATSFSSMRDQDSLCFVLPSTWTQARYGRELRSWLWRVTQRPVEMHLFPTDVRIFPGTKVSAMVLYVGPRAASPQRLSRHSAGLADHTITTTPAEYATRTGDPPPSLGPWLWKQRRILPGKRVPLGELAVVRRGVATGANFFFFLTDDEAAELPKEATRRALRRLRHVTGDVLDTAAHRRIGAQGKPSWILTLGDPKSVESAAVQRRLAAGEDAGVPDRYLSTVREPWYLLENVEPPHLLCGIMSKDRLRVVRNVVKAVHSNSMYGIYLRQPSLSRPLADWLNSSIGQESLLSQARHYSDGLKKIEPKDLKQALIPPAELLRKY
jgi:adenine-specific DNA-methyltransferase